MSKGQAAADSSAVHEPQLQQITPKKRFAGVDIVKILAGFLVVTVHFFLWSGFYGEPIDDKSDIAPIALRWFSYTCVPLFMIVSGYLMKNKTLSKKYYLGILRVVIIYIIVSIICSIFDHYHFMKEFTVWTYIKGMFEYTNASYSWYVAYYICMFMLMPFVNLAFNNLKSKKHKLIMVFTVFAVSSLSYSFFIGTEQNNQIKIFPQYFSNCYPFAYYLAGCFIREYPPKRCLRNKLIFAAGLAASLSWLTYSTYVQSLDNVDYNYSFLSWHYNDYGTWPVCLTALFIFLLIFDITVKNKHIAAFLKIFGESTFASYLISYVFDRIYYESFGAQYPTFAERWSHAPLIICKVFFSAIAIAIVIQIAYNTCDSQIRKLYRKSKENKSVQET